MSKYTFLINLFKSRLNIHNYIQIYEQSLNQVVSLDIINKVIEYILEDKYIQKLDKFLKLSLYHLNTNILFYDIFIKSQYQNLLEINFNYNLYIKFKDICSIIKCSIEYFNESFYNSLIYYQFSKDHLFRKLYNMNDLSVVEINLWKEIVFTYKNENMTNDIFIEYYNKLEINDSKDVNSDICNSRYIGNSTTSIYSTITDISANTTSLNDLKYILTSINSVPDYFDYHLLKYYDTTDIRYESLIISYLKSSLNKDIYHMKKVVNIMNVLVPSRKILFGYFVYLYVTYNKYTNKYIKDRILSIVYHIKFSCIYDMIVEYYITVHKDGNNRNKGMDKKDEEYIDTKRLKKDDSFFIQEIFSDLEYFLNDTISSRLQIVYPLLFHKCNLYIEEYHHYVTVQNILNNKDNKDNINYKEIALLLTKGYFSLYKYKLYIKNNISMILSILKYEYNNKNISISIFNILRYLTDNLNIYISPSIFEYFKIRECQDSELSLEECIGRQDEVVTRVFFRVLDKKEMEGLDERKKIDGNLYTNTILYIRKFIKTYQTNLEYAITIRKLYHKFPMEVLRIIGHIKIDNKKTYRKIKICNTEEDIIKHIKEEYINDIYIDNKTSTLYNEVMDILYYNAESSYQPSTVLMEDIEKTKNYSKFLILLNDKLSTQSYRILRYGKIFGIRLLEFSLINLISLIVNDSNGGDIEDLKNGNSTTSTNTYTSVISISLLFNTLLKDKINHKILKFILTCHIHINNKLCLDTNLLISACILVKYYYHLIFIIENELNCTTQESYTKLQEAYYKIGDFIRVKGINSKYVRLDKSNLEYEFMNNELEDNYKDIYRICTPIEEDFKEYKNISCMCTLSVHFKEDCRMVDEDIRNLYLVSERRKICEDIRIVLMHDVLYSSLIKNKDRYVLNRKDIIDKEYISVENTNTTPIENTYINIINTFRIGVKRDLIKYFNKTGRYQKSLNIIKEMLINKEWSFYMDLSEIYHSLNKKTKSKECLRKLMCIYSPDTEIYKESLLKYTELVNDRNVYKKNIAYLNNVSRVWFFYGKCIEEEDKLSSMEYYLNSISIDDKYKYECIPRIFHILSELKDKKEIRTGIEIVEKAFNIETSGKDIVGSNVGNKGVSSNGIGSKSRVIRRVSDTSIIQGTNTYLTYSILIPFFSQIISKILHKTCGIFIKNLVLNILEGHREVYWHALYFIDKIDTDTLSIENKVYLNKIIKMRDILYEISKCKKTIISLKDLYKDIYNYIGMDIPGKKGILIEDIESNIFIYKSLQAPKKICFMGSDGCRYYYLCKYKDDLRKDSRFGELSTLINKLFKKNNLEYYIKTYLVIPCFYDFGLIECIEGLCSMKSILSKEYPHLGKVCAKYLRSQRIGLKDFEEVLSKFKPCMREYIKSSSNQDVIEWYKRRDRYTKTYAVMNIVGWFMGLGDRHTENILFDTSTLDTVHVDLNCIFDKGKTTSIPEMVPFRLTQNVVDGFGVLGVYGTYTTSCIHTLDILKSNRDLILSNLLSFVFDPIHEWKRASLAESIISQLYKKIGHIDIETKVEELNDEAMNPSNLCMMYIGWLSFI